MKEDSLKNMQDGFATAYDDFIEGEIYQIDTKIIRGIREDNIPDYSGFVYGNIPCLIANERIRDVVELAYISPVKANMLNGVIIYNDSLNIGYIKDENNIISYEKSREYGDSFFGAIKIFKEGLGRTIIYSCCNRLLNIQKSGIEKLIPFKFNYTEFHFFNHQLELDFIMKKTTEFTFSLSFKAEKNGYSQHFSHTFILNSKKLTEESLFEYSDKTYAKMD